MEKVGRNNPCPCGAMGFDGRPVKYKKCHMVNVVPAVPHEVIQSIREKMAKKDLQRQKLRAMGIYIDFVNPVSFNGKQVWALGNQIYSGPPDETFHEFLVAVLQGRLGKQWLSEESIKSKVDQHFTVQCFSHWTDWRRRNSQLPENRIDAKTWAAKPDGWSLSLVSLAFDIASLLHRAVQTPEQHLLLGRLMERLRSQDGYQGVRYEVMVASVFARLGFEIEFYDDKTEAGSHGEFVARHPTLGTVVVEAKSRYRKGVLHHPGEAKGLKDIWGGLRGPLNRAVKKASGSLPLVVFIDVNAPSGTDTPPKWVSIVQSDFQKNDPASPENPDPFSVVFFTNYAYHYATDQEADHGEQLMVFPQFAVSPLPNPELAELVYNALHHYGQVPLIKRDEE